MQACERIPRERGDTMTKNETTTTTAGPGPTPGSKGKLRHQTCLHGVVRWHWYVDEQGNTQVCGCNQRACEEALKADGYEIESEEDAI